MDKMLDPSALEAFELCFFFLLYMHDSSKKPNIYEFGINFQTSLPTVLFVFFHLASAWFHLPCYKHWVAFRRTQTHTGPPGTRQPAETGNHSLFRGLYFSWCYLFRLCLFLCHCAGSNSTACDVLDVDCPINLSFPPWCLQPEEKSCFSAVIFGKTTQGL